MKPCRLCGSTRVTRQVVEELDPSKERVIVMCEGCDVARSSYSRKRKPKPLKK